MSSDTNDNIRKISEDRSSIHVIIYWPELFCYPIKSVGLISSSAGFCLWLFRFSSVHPVDACTINYLLISTNQLDLVPPVPLGTSGSSLTPFWTVSCNIFNLLPLEVDHLQILLESSEPRLRGASGFTPAIRWSPAYCHFRRSMHLVSVVYDQRHTESAARSIFSLSVFTFLISSSLF